MLFAWGGNGHNVLLTGRVFVTLEGQHPTQVRNHVYAASQFACVKKLRRSSLFFNFFFSGLWFGVMPASSCVSAGSEASSTETAP